MIFSRTTLIVLSLMALHCSSGGGDDGGELENTASLFFDGEDDFGSAGDIDITLSSTFETCSISLWFKPEVALADGSMMMQFNPELEGSRNSMQISIYWDTSERIAVHWTPDFEGVPGARLFADLEAPEDWNHLLVSFDANADSNNVRLYVNGAEVDAADQGTPMDAIGNIQFGREGTGINHFNGYLDEAAIWEAALTGDEARSVYRDGRPGNVLVDYASYKSSMELQSFWRMGDENFPMEANVSDRISGNNFTIVNGGDFVDDTP